MYVYNETFDEQGDDGDDNTIFWCLKTSQGFGPDDGRVGRYECCDASRSCYQAL
jgi:hypothetical protein